MFEIYKTVSFESAHLLEGHPKCGKLHGHSYKMEVWISAKQLQAPWAFVLDFHAISDIAKEYDHSNKVIQISCEQLAQEICNKLESKVQGNIRVRIWETATSWAQYSTSV